MTLRVRAMTPQDITPVAQLHTSSWRATYRGLLRDSYLDGPVAAERLAAWTERLSAPNSTDIALVAEDKTGPLGFLFALPEHDRSLGTLLDNIHVRPDRYGQGIGTCLLTHLCDRLINLESQTGVYLWATEGNLRSRKYYQSLGASAVERAVHDVPGSEAIAEWLYRWETIKQLHENVLTRHRLAQPDERN